jgi:hypothetical protein
MIATAIPVDDSVLTQAEVESAELSLRGQLRGRVSGLCLSVCTRGVILRGYSRTYYGKQLAQHMLMALCRFPIAANEIVVS